MTKRVKALELLKTMFDGKALMPALTWLLQTTAEVQNETCHDFLWGTSNAKSYATEISLGFRSLPSRRHSRSRVRVGLCLFDNKDEARPKQQRRLIAFICDDAEWGPKSVCRQAHFPVRASMATCMRVMRNSCRNWTKYYGPYYNHAVLQPACRVVGHASGISEGDVQKQVEYSTPTPTNNQL